MRVRNGIIVNFFLVLLIISAGCTVYEKEEEYPVFDDTIYTSPSPPVSPASPAPPVQTQVAIPVSVNPSTGYSMENFTPEITSVPEPNPPLRGYYPVFSQQYRLMYNLEGPHGLEIVCNEAPIRIQFESNPDHENIRLSYAYWELTDIETGEVIEEGGFSLKDSTQKTQTITLLRTGTFHLNLYGARINVKVTVLSPHAADLVLQQPQITSPDEEEYYW
jgi:hypothetical protein